MSSIADCTRPRPELLQANRIDLCALHLGTEEEAHPRHPAILRGIYFRRLFQQLLATLHDEESRHLAGLLQGCDLTPCGNLVWSDD